MSLLPPEVHSALGQLLRALSTADNTVRTQAEEQLNNDWALNRPDVLLMGLVEQIQAAEDTIVSHAGFDLFRQRRYRSVWGDNHSFLRSDQNCLSLALFIISLTRVKILGFGCVNHSLSTIDTHIRCSAFPKNSHQDTKRCRYQRSQGTLFDPYRRTAIGYPSEAGVLFDRRIGH